MGWDGLGEGAEHSLLSCSLAVCFPGRHSMPRDRAMPGMYPNAVPLAAYGSPYARPLMASQQQIPKLLPSKCPLLPAPLGCSTQLSSSVSLCCNMIWKENRREWEGETTRQALQFQINPIRSGGQTPFPKPILLPGWRVRAQPIRVNHICVNHICLNSSSARQSQACLNTCFLTKKEIAPDFCWAQPLGCSPAQRS